MSNFYLVGSGTDIGKTYVSAALLRSAQASGRTLGYYKPVMSGNQPDAAGNLIPGDPSQVKILSETEQSLESMCGTVYAAALSPHLAAQLESGPITLESIQRAIDHLKPTYPQILIEACGGVICPLRWDHERIMQTDLIHATQAKCILVADAGLGSINATVLSVAYLKCESIPLAGIILNRFDPQNKLHQDNLMMIEQLSGHPIVATLEAQSLELTWRSPHSIHSLLK